MRRARSTDPGGSARSPSSAPEPTPELEALEAGLAQKHWDAWICCFDARAHVRVAADTEGRRLGRERRRGPPDCDHGAVGDAAGEPVSSGCAVRIAAHGPNRFSQRAVPRRLPGNKNDGRVCGTAYVSTLTMRPADDDTTGDRISGRRLAADHPAERPWRRVWIGLAFSSVSSRLPSKWTCGENPRDPSASTQV